TASPSTGAAAVVAAAPTPDPRVMLMPVAARPGVRLTFLDKDPISQVEAGETTLTLVETTSTQRVYNDGALVTLLDGTPVKGRAHASMIYGIAPRELQRGGSWKGKYKAASIAEDVPATFTVVGKQAKTV